MLSGSDLPKDVKEAAEQKLGELFPGFKILYAGDEEVELPKEVLESWQALEKKTNDSFVNGTCLDCGKQMENFDKEDFDIPQGWKLFTQEPSKKCKQYLLLAETYKTSPTPELEKEMKDIYEKLDIKEQVAVEDNLSTIPIAFICPECDKKEQEEGDIHLVNLKDIV